MCISHLFQVITDSQHCWPVLCCLFYGLKVIWVSVLLRVMVSNPKNRTDSRDLQIKVIKRSSENLKNCTCIQLVKQSDHFPTIIAMKPWSFSHRWEFIFFLCLCTECVPKNVAELQELQNFKSLLTSFTLRNYTSQGERAGKITG